MPRIPDHNTEIASELEETLVQMKDLLRKAERLLQDAPEQVRDRASVYWVAHIKCALDHDHHYGREALTMIDTVNELLDIEQ